MNRNQRSIQFILVTLFTGLILSACDKEKSSDAVESITDTVISDAPMDPAATTATAAVWQQGNTTLQHCIDDSRLLREQVRNFLAEPTLEQLNQTRARWHQAHQHMVHFAAFFSLADNNPGLFGELAKRRFQLDGQPIQPGFIDYFSVYLQSGIVNDIAITLSAEALRNQHGITDFTDVSIGFHAMEFLLWGENGERPESDFTALTETSSEQAQQGLRTVDLANNRRRVYTQLLAELLVDDCSRLKASWQDSTLGVFINYHALQPASRIQLWRAIITDEINWLRQALVASNTSENSDPASESNNEPEVIAHNRFAGQEQGFVAQRLRGLRVLLYGQNLETEAPDTAGLARWIAAPTHNNEANDLSSLRLTFDQVTESLSTESTWPLSASAYQGLVDLLDASHLAIHGQETSDPVTGPATSP